MSNENRMDSYKTAYGKNPDRMRSKRQEATVRKINRKCLLHGTDDFCLD